MTMPYLNIKAVIFDLDGTLLDTAADLVASNNATLQHFGFQPITEDLARTKVTSGMREMLKLGVPQDQWESAGVETTMRDYFYHYYLDHICDYTQPFQGMLKLLDDLKQANIKIAVVTNKYEDMTHKLLKKFPFYNDISLILGCDSLSHSKPHPEPILKTLDVFELAPFEAIYVGDHLNDIKAANQAKTHSAIALWGYGTKECGNPQTWHANFMLEDVAQLHKLVLG